MSKTLDVNHAYMLNQKNEVFISMFKSSKVNSPPNGSISEDFAISAATNEVVTLNRGMLNNFDIMLKIETDTPTEANSSGPIAKSGSTCRLY